MFTVIGYVSGMDTIDGEFVKVITPAESAEAIWEVISWMHVEIHEMTIRVAGVDPMLSQYNEIAELNKMANALRAKGFTTDFCMTDAIEAFKASVREAEGWYGEQIMLAEAYNW